MGYRLEVVSQKILSGTDALATMIVGDYVYTAGNKIERFRIDRMAHTLGNGEVLGPDVPERSSNMAYNGENIFVGGNGDGWVHVFNPDLYDNYVSRQVDYVYSIGDMQFDSLGDLHLIYSPKTWKACRVNGTEITVISEFEANAEVLTVINNLVFLGVDSSPAVKVFKWDGTSYQNAFTDDCPNFIRAITTVGNKVVAATYEEMRVYGVSGDSINLLNTHPFARNTNTRMWSNGSEVYMIDFSDKNLWVCNFDHDTNTMSHTHTVPANFNYYATYQNARPVHGDHQYVVFLDGNTINLAKRVLVAQAEFPNGTSLTAGDTLTAIAI